ncbi:MAG: MFS transporter [Acetobacteraceae bacterium]|nr:MFS transporter [Acetobacteraceae bacterium]
MNHPTDGIGVPARHWAMLTIALGVSMAVLDGSIANVALPTIARDVGATPANAVWVVNAYQLAVTVSLLACASLGEIVGYRRVYLTGLAVMTLASLACALSGSLLALSLARVLQGLGASAMMGVNIAQLRFVYPRRMLGTALGINAMVVAVSAAIGPTLASAILSAASWQWLFLVNVPIGAIAVLIGSRVLPETPRGTHAFDWLSALLNAAAFGLLITGIDEIGHGEAPLLVALEIAGGVGFFWLLVRRQGARAAPLLPVDLLRIPMFSLSVLTSVCSYAAQMLAYVSLPFFLQDTLGYGQVATGLLMTPWPVAVAVAAPLSGRLTDRYPAGVLGSVGLFIMACGLVLLATLPAHATPLNIGWRMALCGAGFGLFQTPNNRTLMASAPSHRSGGAGGMLATARLLGQTTGAALVAVAFSFFAERGGVVSLGGGAVCAAAAAAVSLLRLSGRAKAAPRASVPGEVPASGGVRHP